MRRTSLIAAVVAIAGSLAAPVTASRRKGGFVFDFFQWEHNPIYELKVLRTKHSHVNQKLVSAQMRRKALQKFHDAKRKKSLPIKAKGKRAY